MLISVIVPLYNAEKCISRCLESLVNQTYQNIEIIVIDDGSTDNSADIVKEYVEKYKNIIFIQNKKNKKTFETKRIGMETATGDYIGFCDSDDCHELNSFEYMLNRIQEKDYDMVTVNANNENKSEHSYFNKELFFSLINQGERYFMPVSLFKKEVIKNALKEVDFYIEVAHGEDHLWRLIILYYVKSSLHTTPNMYTYYNNKTSVSKQNNDIKINIFRIKEDSCILEKMKEFLIKKNIEEKYIAILINRFYIFPLKSLNFLKNTTNDYIDIWLNNASNDLKKSLLNFYNGEIDLYKKRIIEYEKKFIECEKQLSQSNNRMNILDIIFSITTDKNFIVIFIFGIQIKIKKK